MRWCLAAMDAGSADLHNEARQQPGYPLAVAANASFAGGGCLGALGSSCSLLLLDDELDLAFRPPWATAVCRCAVCLISSAQRSNECLLYL